MVNRGNSEVYRPRRQTTTTVRVFERAAGDSVQYGSVPAGSPSICNSHVVAGRFLCQTALNGGFVGWMWAADVPIYGS